MTTSTPDAGAGLVEWVVDALEGFRASCECCYLGDTVDVIESLEAIVGPRVQARIDAEVADALERAATLLDLEAAENREGGVDMDAQVYDAAARIVREQATDPRRGDEGVGWAMSELSPNLRMGVARMSELSEGLEDLLYDLVAADRQGKYDGLDIHQHVKRFLRILDAREAAWRGEVDGLRADAINQTIRANDHLLELRALQTEFEIVERCSQRNADAHMAAMREARDLRARVEALAKSWCDWDAYAQFNFGEEAHGPKYAAALRRALEATLDAAGADLSAYQAGNDSECHTKPEGRRSAHSDSDDYAWPTREEQR